MKAPSLSALQALHLIAFPTSRQTCRVAAAQRRFYAAIPPAPKEAPQSPSPNTEAKTPPAVQNYTKPSKPDGKTEKDDDDKDHVPQPLTRPIGMPTPPQPGDNRALDHRSIRQRRDDFVNYEKHLEKRARMTKQISKPYFRDWSNLRFEKGKSFIAPDRLFRADVSLWFPNFFGRTLAKEKPANSEKRDGYGGYGRDTCDAMGGKVSVVSVVSSQWAQQQVASFCSKNVNPALHQVLAENKGVVQRVWINYEPNILKYWLIQLFSGSLRKEREKDAWSNYFVVRRGISDIVREAIGFLNEKVGYVYLVDADSKIRWAGSAIASGAERESMVRGLRRLADEEKNKGQAKSKTPQKSREKAV
ncbi:hypothetical protein K431DRAFT_288255 [Polychaeton citri CBS 116435]|uniref:Uncharacterized protein n=1 Tax=Polychaeton citri CBS 116435 TaxID=1314669 RepID=A0A9P4Q1L1_9PEZI|nr:hypothetical protein K431DRAFT_288255 [Polychaeton citri CBS 116435]